MLVHQIFQTPAVLTWFNVALKLVVLNWQLVELERDFLLDVGTREERVASVHGVVESLDDAILQLQVPLC